MAVAFWSRKKRDPDPAASVLQPEPAARVSPPVAPSGEDSTEEIDRRVLAFINGPTPKEGDRDLAMVNRYRVSNGFTPLVPDGAGGFRLTTGAPGELAEVEAAIETQKRIEQARVDYERSSFAETIARHGELSARLSDSRDDAEKVALATELVSFSEKTAEARHVWSAVLRKSLGRVADDSARDPVGSSRHLGFERLAINAERERRLDEAIAICQQARRQGWAGDWDKRIERMEQKTKRAE